MKSIFSKLILSFLAIIILAIATISMSFSGLLNNYLTKQTETQLQNKGNQIASLSRDYLNKSMDEYTFSYIINSIDEVVNSRTIIVDRTGFIAYASSKDKAMSALRGVRIDENDMIQILRGATIAKKGYSFVFNETMITVGLPIYSSDRKTYVIGAVILNSPVTGVTEAMHSMVVMLVFAGLGALALSLLTAYFLSKTLSKPIHIISNAAVEIAEGNYSKKVDIDRRDEIGNLASAFNYLTVKLDNTIGDLSNEKRKLSDILYSIDEGLIAVDMDLNIIHANPAAYRLFNAPAAVTRLSDMTKISEIEESIKHVLNTGRNKSYETEIYKNRFVNILISPLKYQDGSIYGAIILIQDISESVKLEKMRRDFVANVSHELRTPLTAIRGFIEPLIDGTIDDNKTMLKYHSIIRSETLRLERLINDLLDLSRLQSGKIKLDIQKVDITELITNVSNKFRPLLDSKDIELIFDRPGTPVYIMADGDRVEQLIMIFMDNAIKFTPDGRSITIKLLENTDIVMISITDDGVGIPKEDLPYIWDRFYKVDKSRTDKKSGTGLGLSIARNIIELHGQKAYVESQPGQGTTFGFTMKRG